MLIDFGRLTQATASKLTTAVLPLAAMEAHGSHLPLATDRIIIDAILDRVATTQPVARLPCLWLGASAEHADRPGTLSQDAETMIAQILAIGEGLARTGITRLVLANGHGGNRALGELAALKLRTRCKMLVANAHWLDFGLPEGFQAPANPAQDWHGGWMETSIMLALDPGMVGKAKSSPAITDGLPPLLAPQGPIGWGWMTSDLSPSGTIGRPELASARIGETLLDHAADGFGHLLDQMAAARSLS